jgi:hypothetical protein
MFARPHATHNQIAYVTNDMDAAIALLTRRYALPGFLRISVEQSSASLTTGEKLQLGLARANGVEIELIQPMGGSAPLFSDVLPATDGLILRFHHICYRIDGGIENWHAYEASIDKAEHPIVFSGGLPDDMRFFYTDERKTLGHYVEHIWMSPAMLVQMAAAIPTYPAAIG